MSATGDNSYAPRSPDLSSFYSGSDIPSIPSRSSYNYLDAFPNHLSPHPLQQQQLQSQSRTQAQAQAQAHAHAQAQAQARSQVQTQLQGPPNLSQPQSPHHHHQPHYYNNINNSSSNNSSTATATATITNHSAFQPQGQHQHHQPSINNRSTYEDNTSHPSLASYAQQLASLYQQPNYVPPYQPGYHPQAAPSYHPSYTEPTGPTSSGYSASPAIAQEPPQHRHNYHQQAQQPLVFDQLGPSDSNATMPRGKAAAQVVKEPEIMESPVRTKFPTARIKRIMQADEEVGKVAQQTPIAVGKALELFMVQLVQKSAEVAKDKNSKRITAAMLKQAIDSTNEWDFLRDIVAKVVEEKEGARSGKSKVESESDDEAEAVEVKKRGRGGGRKRKAAA
ncbi:hypothetical protein GGS20DRAFT_354237 [Poronia punctata]|nr:hypothetical protein GGS20DRAFT_354237 [Poronia punctata]